MASKEVSLSYYDNGQLKTVDLYASTNGSNQVADGAYVYDHAGRLTSLTYSFQNSTASAPSYQWAYDNAGRVTDFYSWLDSSGTPSYSNVATWAHAEYNYDHAGQLASSGSTAAVHYSNWQNAPADENYSYDANGNRSGGNNYTGPGNQTWEDAAGNEYWYDNEGDRVREDLANDAGTILYTYDNRHRLTSEAYGAYDQYGQFQATETIVYTYDVFDRLVGKTVSGSKTDKEVYVYDGENMILKFQNSTGEALTNSDLVRRFLDGAAVDQVFAEEVTLGASSVQTRWLLADNEGTIRDVATYAAGATTVQDHLVNRFR